MNAFKPLQGLRLRYSLTAAVVVLLLLIALVFTYRYITRISHENSQSLILIGQVNKQLNGLRTSIRKVEVGLQDLLSTSGNDQHAAIKQHLAAATAHIAQLYNDPVLRRLPGFTDVATLHTKISLLTIHLERLLRKRQDPAWVYPALPLIAGTMNDNNREFEGALALALAEVTEQLDEPKQLRIYQQLMKIRGLWRRLILDFRVKMINFAGVATQPAEPDDRDLEQVYTLLSDAIGWLRDNPLNATYGLETEAAIPLLVDSAHSWHDSLAEVQQLRAAGLWRADINYVRQHIRPLQDQIDLGLQRLAAWVATWSEDNAIASEAAARHINHILWLVAALVLALVIIAYLVLDRSLLRPLSQISESLGADLESTNPLPLSAHGSPEIATLVNAFERLRVQIQHRQQALEHQALHDDLTGLPNRSLMQDRLDQGLRQAIRSNTELGLLFLDLDRFKEINDSLGHQAGDLILQRVATRLRGLLRDSDTVARLGGDEFAIILPQLDRAAALEVAEKIAHELDRPFNLDGKLLYLGASIGIVTAPRDGVDANDLIRRADSAMYRAKRSNRSYAFFNSDDPALSAGLFLTSELREALSAGDALSLRYQPRLDLHRRQIIGAEALLRWQRRPEEWVSPEYTVQLAEQANLIDELTAWVLERALGDCARSHRTGRPFNVSVNLSTCNLDDHELPLKLARMLERHRLEAQYLTLEITENAVMANPENARHILQQLAELGVTLSIDDFGTGFSSLAYLKLLPVHELKIDKSFVINMDENKNDAVIVQSTIDLGHNLGLQVIAEGVETEQTLQVLQQRGCDQAQGYFIARPLPLPDFIAMLSQ